MTGVYRSRAVRQKSNEAIPSLYFLAILFLALLRPMSSQWGAPHPEAEAGAAGINAADWTSKGLPFPSPTLLRTSSVMRCTISTLFRSRGRTERSSHPTRRTAAGRRKRCVGQPGTRQYAQRESLVWNYLRSTSLADDRDAIARTLWEMTNREYRRASPAYAKVISNTACRRRRKTSRRIFRMSHRQTQLDHPGAPIAFNQKDGKQRSGIFVAFRSIPMSTVRR